MCVCFQIGVYVINIESFRYNLESFRSKNVSMMSCDDVARPQYIVNAVPLIHIIWKRTVYVISKRVCTLSTLCDEVCVRFQIVCTFSTGIWVGRYVGRVVWLTNYFAKLRPGRMYTNVLSSMEASKLFYKPVP